MKLGELFTGAGKFYPEDFIARYFDPVRERVRWMRAGDILAGFIMVEILETFDPAAPSHSKWQLFVAVHPRCEPFAGLLELNWDAFSSL